MESRAWPRRWVSIAYSPISQRFLVVSVGNYTLYGRLLDVNGTPIGGIIPIAGFGSQFPGVTWNPVTNEFGVSYSAWDGGAHASFTRVRPDGAVLSNSVFGYGGLSYNTDVSANPVTGAYVMGWAMPNGSNYALFDPRATSQQAA